MLTKITSWSSSSMRRWAPACSYTQSICRMASSLASLELHSCSSRVCSLEAPLLALIIILRSHSASIWRTGNSRRTSPCFASWSSLKFAAASLAWCLCGYHSLMNRATLTSSNLNKLYRQVRSSCCCPPRQTSQSLMLLWSRWCAHSYL